MKYTTRADFPAVLPDHWVKYCFGCHAEGPKSAVEGNRKVYICESCGKTYNRFLTYDSKMVSYFDDQERLVHGSCGVIPVRPDGKLLLFQRTKFPFLLTIPAGHMEYGEAADACAAREMQEEMGIAPRGLQPVFEGVIVGDQCVGGADLHDWHAFVTLVDADVEPVMGDDEGTAWGWYDADELTEANTVQPLLMLLAKPDVRQKMHAVSQGLV